MESGERLTACLMARAVAPDLSAPNVTSPFVYIRNRPGDGTTRLQLAGGLAGRCGPALRTHISRVELPPALLAEPVRKRLRPALSRHQRHGQ